MMQFSKKLVCRFMTSVLAMAFSAASFGYTHTVLHPITWQGEKWEYLVENPSSVHHVDPVLFEEILDTAGQHGWRLVSVSSENHFYTFYFERPLLPHKIDAHRARLTRVKNIRAEKEAKELYQIQTSSKQAAVKQTAPSSAPATTPPAQTATPIKTQPNNLPFFSKIKSKLSL